MTFSKVVEYLKQIQCSRFVHQVVRCNLPDNNRETVGVVPICVDAKTHTPRCMTGTSKISKFDQRVWSVTLKLSRLLMPKNPHTTMTALVVGG